MTINLINTKPSQLKENVDFFDSSILDFISVTKPYFALQNLKRIDEYFYADFTTELINCDEEGPISGAEVGRHLAILGSVVLANANPAKEKHHYLATDAYFKRCHSKTSTNFNLKSRAKLVSLNRKKGLVYGELIEEDGTILYTIEVTYMVLGKSIFERMFAPFRVEENIIPTTNPYKSEPEFFDLKIEMKSCSATIGKVLPEHCPGHFNHYPALPVARLGTSMGKIGGLHFMHLNPSCKDRYLVSNAEIHARQLVFTGEEVKFKTEIIDLNPEKGMIIRAIAYTGEHNIVAESISNYHY